MDIQSRTTVELQIILNGQDLKEMEQDPASGVAPILRRARQEGLLNNLVQHAAKKRGSSCPLCGKPVKQQGLGIHFSKTHSKTYKEWLAADGRKGKRAKKPKSPLTSES